MFLPVLWGDGGNVEGGKLVVVVENLMSPGFEFSLFLDPHTS